VFTSSQKAEECTTQIGWGVQTGMARGAVWSRSLISKTLAHTFLATRISEALATIHSYESDRLFTTKITKSRSPPPAYYLASPCR